MPRILAIATAIHLLSMHQIYTINTIYQAPTVIIAITQTCQVPKHPMHPHYPEYNPISVSSQGLSSFQNTPISSSSPGTNELDIFSSQYNSRKFNPSHDQKISKYKPLTYKIETSVFSNKNWPTYKPVGVRYLDRVTNSK